MRQRLPLVLSAIALAVAVLGSTPVGQAAREAVSQVVPRNSVGTAQLKKSAVGTAQLKRGAVGTQQLKRNAVTSNKVTNRSLLAIDFAVGQLPQGEKGDKGDKGDKGEKGDAGPAGAVSTVVTRSATQTVADGVYLRLTASCNSGEKAVGGGVGTTSTASDVSVRESKPTNGGFEPASGGTFTSWTGALLNITGGVATAELKVWVVCVT